MKPLLLAVFLLLSGSGVQAQSCLTSEDVSRMLARVDSPPPAKPDKKLKEELLKLLKKERELLMEVVGKNQTKTSDSEKLHKAYEDHAVQACPYCTS